MNRLMLLLIPGTALLVGFLAYLVADVLGDDEPVAVVNGVAWGVGVAVMLTWRHLRTGKGGPDRNG